MTKKPVKRICVYIFHNLGRFATVLALVLKSLITVLFSKIGGIFGIFLLEKRDFTIDQKFFGCPLLGNFCPCRLLGDP